MKRLALLLLLLPLPSDAFEQCHTREVGGGFVNELCKFEDSEQWARFIYHPEDENTQLVFEHQGWPAKTYADPDSMWDSGGVRGETIIRLNSENFPVEPVPPDKTSGPYMGKNPYGDRMLLAASKMNAERSLDVGAGICNRGHSQGGRAAMLQSMIAPNPIFRALFTCTNATEGWPLITRKPEGLYWADPSVRQSWGNFPLIKSNVHWNMALGQYDKRLTKLYGSRTSTLGKTDPYFFQLCDQYQVPCWGAWHMGDHTDEPGVFDGQRNQHIRFAQWPGTHHKIRLDKTVPVFTLSTANHWGEKGHYNLGLSAVLVPPYTTDKPDMLRVSLAYQAHTLLGGGIPDQPTEATFTLTLRNIQHFQNKGTLNWSMGSQSGTVERTGKEITIEGLTLESGEPLPLVITPESDPLVYVRQPMTDKPHLQVVRDVARPYGGDPADLVIDGKVVHDCVSQGCTVSGPKVSPDATQIAYAVSWPNSIGVHEKSHLWLYQVRSGQKRQITTEGRAYSPEWASNTEIYYTSDKDGLYAPISLETSDPRLGNYYPYPMQRLYRGTLKSGQFDQSGDTLWPHAVFVMDPAHMSNGDVCASVWWGYWPRKPGTHVNFWVLECSDREGRNSRAMLGAHGCPHIKTRPYYEGWASPLLLGEAADNCKALRGIVELRKGYVATTNYYRGTHVGQLGSILGWERLFDKEGVLVLDNFKDRNAPDSRPGSGRFIPSTLKSLTPWGTSADASWPVTHKDWRSAGTAGYPFRMREGHGITWGKGYCYVAKAEQDSGCQQCIYQAFGQVTNPFTQLKELVCPKGFHVREAQVIAPYSELLGV